MVYVSILMGLLAGAFAAKTIRYHWPRKGNFGMNFEDVFCPDCGAKMPKSRIPKSWDQALWGGWTCSLCGCLMNKYGEKK